MNFQNIVQRFYQLFLMAFCVINTSACIYILDPITYKLAIQQGNVLEKEQVDKLEIGMTQEQVSFVLGSPIIEDTFMTDRWDYVYRYKSSHGKITEESLFVEFKAGKLTNIGGSFLEKIKAEEKEKSSS
ncbi:MAG: outer membrane protein assembly factor BamE [Pseudomonadota bacterium]